MHDGPAPAEPPGVLDPWGRPFRWEESSMTVLNQDGACLVYEHHFPVSQGPTPDEPSDDIDVNYDVPKVADEWKIGLIERPGLPALALVGWLTSAWWTLRRRSRAGPLLEIFCVLGASAPALIVAWAAPRTEVGLRYAETLPQVVPGTWAISLSIYGLALVAALGVRVASRGEARA